MITESQLIDKLRFSAGVDEAAVARQARAGASAAAVQWAAAQLATSSRNSGRTQGPRWGRKDGREASARERNTAG